MQSLFSVFCNEEVGPQAREQVLLIVLNCLRMVSWADGYNPEVVEAALGDTFKTWMAILLQTIQSNPRAYFDIKKNALKCLTVVFRDLWNYSRECINLILKPAWKLLNNHLPVYTEVVAYGQPIEGMRLEDDDEVVEIERGYESDDAEDSYGVEGMTLQLLELLTTLVQRHSVHEVVRVGIIPLIATVASFMAIPASREHPS